MLVVGGGDVRTSGPYSCRYYVQYHVFIYATPVLSNLHQEDGQDDVIVLKHAMSSLIINTQSAITESYP